VRSKIKKIIFLNLLSQYIYLLDKLVSLINKNCWIKNSKNNFFEFIVQEIVINSKTLWILEFIKIDIKTHIKISNIDILNGDFKS